MKRTTNLLTVKLTALEFKDFFQKCSQVITAKAVQGLSALGLKDDYSRVRVQWTTRIYADYEFEGIRQQGDEYIINLGDRL